MSKYSFAAAVPYIEYVNLWRNSMRDSSLVRGFAFRCVLVSCVSALISCDRGDHVVTADLPIGKTWALTILNGEGVDQALLAITLRFDSNGSLSGFDGCNRFRGSYASSGNSVRIEGHLVSTRAACREALMRFATTYSEALSRVASFSVDGDQLRLENDEGREVAVFELLASSLAGSSWQVTAYNNGEQAVVSILADTRITAHFGTDGRMTGGAGCNQYAASYSIEDGAIDITQVGATRRLCAEPSGVMDQEAGFLEALPTVATFQLEGERLSLRAPDGALAVIMVRD